MDTRIFKALAEENRLRIVWLLMDRELCVCEIEAILDMTQSNASRHLNILRGAGIVAMKKESQWAYYGISRDFVGRHRKLYEYLCESVCGETFARDGKRLAAYLERGFTCQHIHKDWKAVREAIRRPQRTE